VPADDRQPVRRRSLRAAHRNGPPRSRRCGSRFRAGTANRWHPITVPAAAGEVKHKTDSTGKGGEPVHDTEISDPVGGPNPGNGTAATPPRFRR
jgi:hypothetical protein